MTHPQDIIQKSKEVYDYLAGVDEQPPEPVDPPAESKFNSAAFFDVVRRDLFGGSLTQSQVDGHNLIGQACVFILPENGVKLEQSAYCFGTFYHETAHTMQPIEEYGKGSGKSYYPWYGRGFVQLTWEENYERQQLKLGKYYDWLDERGIPWQVHDDWDLALNPETSALISVGGMMDGDFTGKKLDSYIKQGSVDYAEARRIVNGTDRADMIAGYAETYERALKEGFA